MRMVNESEQQWKIGELAKETGLTIRTLHHYDQIGLLTPSRRSASGYRIYSEDDVFQLQKIRSLRNIGFQLGQIAEILNQTAHERVDLIQIQLDSLRAEISQREIQVSRLELVQQILREHASLSTDQLIAATMEVIRMSDRIEKHYTPEQLNELAQRRKLLGNEYIEKVEEEWESLIAQVRLKMEAGATTDDPEVQILADRWFELVESFTGGDPGIHQSLQSVWEDDGAVPGVDMAEMRQMMAFVGKAHQQSQKSD